MSNNSAEMQNAMNQINNLIKNSVSANKLERQQGKAPLSPPLNTIIACYVEENIS